MSVSVFLLCVVYELMFVNIWSCVCIWIHGKTYKFLSFTLLPTLTGPGTHSLIKPARQESCILLFSLPQILKLQASVAMPRFYVGCIEFELWSSWFQRMCSCQLSHLPIWFHFVPVLRFKRIFYWFWIQDWPLPPKCGFLPTPVNFLSSYPDHHSSLLSPCNF